jgi:aryl-alcohol dehydrogenase-like predicted oxidoreductase
VRSLVAVIAALNSCRYGPKRSERLIGEVLRETGARDRVFVATKFGTSFCVRLQRR